MIQANSSITSETRAEMHLFAIISINLYGRNGIKVNEGFP